MIQASYSNFAYTHRPMSDTPIPLDKAITQGNIVIIEGVSQKSGETTHYQILGNQWNLLEVLARLN